MNHHFSSNHHFYLMFTQVELIPPVFPFFTIDCQSLPKQIVPPVQQNVLPTSLPSNKRPERVAVNLDLIYADEENPTEELSFDELRAIKRGKYGIDWNRIGEEQAEEAREQPRKNTHRREVTEEPRAPSKVKTIQSR